MLPLHTCRRPKKNGIAGTRGRPGAEEKVFMDMLLVYVTVPDGETARAMAQTLVEERLCACVNIFDGMTSVYRWRGAVETAGESVCLCKTVAGTYSALEKRIKDLHPYEVPCIVALPAQGGYAPFLQWVAGEAASLA